MDQHVAVFVMPIHGATLLKLVRRLASAAPTTVFSFFNTAKSNRSIFSQQKPHGIHNLRVYDVADGLPGSHKFSGDRLEPIKLFLEVTPGNFRDAMEVAEAEIGMKISCLVGDVFLGFIADMAEEMKINWVGFRTAGLCTVSMHFYTHLIKEKLGFGDITSFGDRTLDFIPGLSSTKVRDLPEGVVFGDMSSPFVDILHQAGLILPRATAIAVNSFEELEPTTNDLKSKLKNLLPIGPLDVSLPSSPISDASGCMQWLDNQKPASVAYVSYGSLAALPANEVVALAEAVEATRMPFLWSIREAAMKNLPDGFLERTSTYGKLVPWAPQPQVLSHSSIIVFITHSGWNSVIESVVGGVPMICRPFFGDQSLNRRIVEDVWGIGVGVKDRIFTKSGVVAALDLIMSNEGKKMRERVLVLKELAARAVEPNGSSSQNFTTLLEIIRGCRLH